MQIDSELYAGSRHLSSAQIDEQARRSVAVFRTMIPSLDAYARVMSGNPRAHVVVSTQTTSATDGTVIEYRPPLALGANPPHEARLCDKRDEELQQCCSACRLREQVLVNIYHEISHIAFGSFANVSDKARAEVLTKSMSIWPNTEWALAFKRRVLRTKMDSFGEMAFAMSPYLHLLVNCLEDARINSEMFEVRPGTRAMFEAFAAGVFASGVEQVNEQGKVVIEHWRDYPLNSQVGVALFCKVSGYPYQGWFAPKVEQDLDDQIISDLCQRAATSPTIGRTFTISLEMFKRLQELGYMQMPEDPAPEPEPEPEPDEQDEADDQEDSDDADEDGDASSAGDDGEVEGDEDDAEADSSDGGSGSDDSDDDSDEGAGDPGQESGDAESDADAGSGDEPGDPADDPSAGGQGDAAGSDADGSADGTSGADDDTEPGEPGGSDQAGDADSEEAGDPEDGDEAGEGNEQTDADSAAGDSLDDGGLSDDGLEELEAGEAEGDGEDDSDSSADGTGELEDQLGGEPQGSQDAGDSDDGSGADDEGAGTDGEDESGDSDGDAPGAGDSETGAAGLDEPDPSPQDYGTPDQAAESLSRWLGHNNSEENARNEDEIVERAIVQAEHFDTPSMNVHGLTVHEHGKSGAGWGRQRPIKISESLLGKALMETRITFEANARGTIVPNLKTGRVNRRVLGRRAPAGDERLFHKRRLPGKRDYFVVIGMDVSGSAAGGALDIEREAVKAQAELLHRVGIKFAIYAHTGTNVSGYDSVMNVEIYAIKEEHEPWDNKRIARLESVQATAYNLDGHTLEYYRKRLDQSSATDKVLMYYTDGAMPNANRAEETDVLKRELLVCKRKGYIVQGVGVGTDSPRKHGLDTVQIDSVQDVSKVVTHLKKSLLK